MIEGKQQEIPEEIKAKRAEFIAHFEKISQDPDVLERAEKFHKKIDSVSLYDLLKRFTI